MKPRTKRILSGAAAAVLAIALVAGGTFAYRNREERKANTVQGMARYQAKLVEEFPENPEWVKDQPIDKPVSIRNMGGTEQHPGDNWGPIYVGLQILEYMDITPCDYTYITGVDTDPTFTDLLADPVRFMVDTKGNFVRITEDQFDGLTGSTVAALLPQLLQLGIWNDVISDSAQRTEFLTNLAEAMLNGDREWLKAKGYFDDEPYYYLPTVEGDPNGQYGAYVVKDVAAVTGERTVITGEAHNPRLVDIVDGQEDAPHDKYLEYYHPHDWTICGNACHEYITVDGIGTEGTDWMWLSDWDGTQGKFWIIDDRSEYIGWAYWGEPLEPGGEQTKDIISSITPIVVPEDLMLYDMYIHMEAYSKGDSEFPAHWPLAPQIVEPGDITLGSLSATVGTPYKQTLAATGTAPITWAITDGELPEGLTLNPNTGAITGTPAAGSAGPYEITVEATNAAGAEEKTFTITVSPAAGPGTEIPVVDNDDEAYKPKVVPGENNKEMCLKSDFFCGYVGYASGTPVIDVGPSTDGINKTEYHYGYLHLADIIDTTDGESLSLIAIDDVALSTLNGGKLTSIGAEKNVWIAADDRDGKGNALSIVYSYVPATFNDLFDCPDFNLTEDADYWIEFDIPLTREVSDGAGGTVTQNVTINVRFTYGDGNKIYTVFDEMA